LKETLPLDVGRDGYTKLLVSLPIDFISQFEQGVWVTKLKLLFEFNVGLQTLFEESFPKIIIV